MIVLILYIQNSQIHRSRKYNRVCQGAAERGWELFTDLGFILDFKKIGRQVLMLVVQYHQCIYCFKMGKGVNFVMYVLPQQQQQKIWADFQI